MRSANFIFYICVILTLNTRVMAQQQNDNCKSVNTLEEKIYGLSLLWSEIKYNFVNIDRLNFDVDSLYRETLQRVLITRNDIEYYKELEMFLVNFNDAHTQLLDMPDSGYEDIDYPKYATKLIDGKFYFTAYRLCADIDPRLLGAEIIEIEGLPVMEYVEKYVMPKITASTLNSKWTLAGIHVLNGKVNTYIKGKARRTNGEIIKFDIIRDGESTRSPSDKSCPNTINEKSDKSVYCDWSSDIAVMTINRFFPESISNDIDNVMNDIKAKNPTGLIIDLRSNGGGITQAAIRLQMHLTKSDSILSFGAQTRSNLGYGRAQGNYRKEYEDCFTYKSYKTFPAEVIEKDKNIQPIQCPVVILIGPYSFSACEDFLINIYEMPERPLLIGEETGGSTGAPLVITLPHEAVARICTLRALYPYSMKPFVGHGILPDIEVKSTINDCLKGIDVVMQKALDILNNKIINLKNSEL